MQNANVPDLVGGFGGFDVNIGDLSQNADHANFGALNLEPFLGSVQDLFNLNGYDVLGTFGLASGRIASLQR